jgi:hypothetical protein
MSCPFACPVAWSYNPGNPCRHGAYGEGVPAKDCPLVSPSEPSCRSVSVTCRLPFPDVAGGWRGVAACPLAGPLARPASPPSLPSHHLACCAAVPAKEKQNRVQSKGRFGGGQ